MFTSPPKLEPRSARKSHIFWARAELSSGIQVQVEPSSDFELVSGPSRASPAQAFGLEPAQAWASLVHLAMVQLPGTVVDIPGTMIDFPGAMVNLPWYTVLWPQQTVRSSCWSSMFIGIRPEPSNKRCYSAYLQVKFLMCRKIHSNTFWIDETFSS